MLDALPHLGWNSGFQNGVVDYETNCILCCLDFCADV